MCRLALAPIALLCAALTVLPACKHGPSERDQQAALTQHDLGAEALRAGRHREALAELLRGEEMDPGNPDIQYALGLTYFLGFGKVDKALHHLQRATTLRKDFSDAHNALANVLMARGEYERAIPHLEKAKSNLLWGTPHLADQGLGWCLYKTGKTDAGIAHLKAAVNMQPKLCGAYDYLATIYAETQRPEESVRWLERYLAACDTDDIRKFVSPASLAGVHYRLGMTLLQVGQRDNAKQRLADCASRFSEEPAGAECNKSLRLVP
jgi:tetratricopeptide (TPR) repeat protein